MVSGGLALDFANTSDERAAKLVFVTLVGTTVFVLVGAWQAQRAARKDR